MITHICRGACSFNKFDYPPIFHRDEDTNPDELRVSEFILCGNQHFLLVYTWILQNWYDIFDLLFFLAFPSFEYGTCNRPDTMYCFHLLCSVIAEDLPFPEKIPESNGKRNLYYQTIHMLIRYSFVEESFIFACTVSHSFWYLLSS